MIECFPALCSIQVHEIQTCRPAHIVRIPKRKRRQIRRQKRKTSRAKRVRFDPVTQVYSLADVPITQTVTEADGPSAINSTCHLRAAPPSNQKRRKYGKKVIQQDATYFPEMGISRTEMIEAQTEDDFCSAIVAFIGEGTLPGDNRLAKQIILRESHYAVVNDIVYYIQVGSGPKAEVTALIVIPLSLQHFVLRAHHDVPIAGHLGPNKMISSMKSRYFWTAMTKDILDYCASCEQCARTKRMTRPIKPPLTIREPSPRPYDTINLDALERLPTTGKGNSHIFVCVDYYSRYVICFAVPDLTAVTFARSFHDRVICRFGAPRRIVMDNGKAFASKHFEHLCAAFNITQAFTTVAHPMASGLVERNNRSILGIIRNYVSESQTDWDEHLDAVAFALNTTAAYSTGHSAFMLVHGYEPLWPTESQLKLQMPTPSRSISPKYFRARKSPANQL